MIADVLDLTKYNVISSRIRLARNIEGMPFPSVNDNALPEVLLKLVTGAAKACEGVFLYDLILMSRLTREQKTAYIEKHTISLALANNNATGAVILESKAESMSIMLNEEDRIREQCVLDGFSLEKAYKRINDYDNNLLKQLPVAYDKQFGFLTACPTNVGTGMRASTMLFLPALKLSRRLDSVIESAVKKYGLTVRGVYGEGSSALGDLYQLSNASTLGLDEIAILSKVAKATVEICEKEREALSLLLKQNKISLFDKIGRSYATLTGAYSLGYEEFAKLASDVRLGVILNILPLNNLNSLQKLMSACSVSTINLLAGYIGEDADVARAEVARKILKEGL